MSDSSKEHKLAAARSKLNQYRSRRSRGRDQTSAVAAALSSSSAGSQASTTVSSRASSCEPVNEQEEHNSAAPASAPAEQPPTDNIAAVTPSDPTSPASVSSLVVEPSPSSSLSDCVKSDATGGPEYRTAASLFSRPYSGATDSASDFFADSVKFALGDATSEQSQDASHPSNVPELLSQHIVTQQHSSGETHLNNNYPSLAVDCGRQQGVTQHASQQNDLLQHQSTNSILVDSTITVSNANTTHGSLEGEFTISSNQNELTTIKATMDGNTSSNPDNSSSAFPEKTLATLDRDSSVESDRTDNTAIRRGSDDPNGNQQYTSEQYLNSREQPNDQPSQEAKSSAESLRQISVQLRGLVNETAMEDSSNTSDESCTTSNMSSSSSSTNNRSVTLLEKSNQDLTQQLQQQQQLTAQQQLQLQQLAAMLQEAQSTSSNGAVSDVATAAGSCSPEEMQQVRQQLQVHIQTVGILVAEKTQLEAQVADLKHSLRGGGEQVSEMEGRLSASRRRVEDLEGELQQREGRLAALDRDNHRLQQQLQLAEEDRDRFKMRCTDNELRVSELAERVSSSGKDQQSLQAQLTDTKTQLHMANIRIEQLRNSSGDSANILDELNQEKRQHQATQELLCQARQQLAQAEADKTHVVSQYQLYTTQLAQQGEQTKAQLAELQQRNQQLEAALQVEKQQLEQMLQNMKQQEIKLQSSDKPDTKQLLEQQQQQLQQLTAQIEQQKEQLQEAAKTNKQLEQDNLSLSRLSDEQRQQVEQLQLSLDRRQTEAVDSGSMLARLQSDKVAAARALAQNKMLKEQLAELQDGFVMMSNKKLELTEKLERELHLKKALHKQQAQAGEDLTALREAGAVREREVEQLRESCSSLARQLAAIKQSQREQQQLAEEQQQQQQQQLNGQPEQPPRSESTVVAAAAAAPPASVSIAGSAQQSSEQQSTVNRVDEAGGSPSAAGLSNGNEVDTQLATITTDCTSSSTVTTTTATTTSTATAATPAAAVNSEGGGGGGETPAGRAALLEYRLAQLSSTHSALVARFQRAMQQVAQLEEDKQNMEVTLEQLQLENDTIGDYITIYQFKRGVLSQQMREKDLELDRLRGDRLTLLDKLARLQELVVSLAQERGDGDGSGATLLSGVNNLLQVAGAAEPNLPSSSHDDPLETSTANGLSNGSNSSPGAALLNGAGEDQSTAADAATRSSSSSSSSPTGSKTVTRILDLIKEMEAQPTTDQHPVQPCGLCSGSLITV